MDYRAELERLRRDRVEAVRSLRADGLPVRRIAELVGASPTLVWSDIREAAEPQMAARATAMLDRMPAGGWLDDKPAHLPDSPPDPVSRFTRSFPVADIALRSGDGRTVEAYAAVFDTPTEINDRNGHYIEVIDPGAFTRALATGIERVRVFYHHALTMHGTPSDLGSVPIGSPVEIRADRKGLRTVTRFNRSDLADAVLESIRNGDITGYSFRGQIRRSDPRRAPEPRGGRLGTWRHFELGLTEYGPTPSPAYGTAAVLAVRDDYASLRDRREELRRAMQARGIGTRTAAARQRRRRQLSLALAMRDRLQDYRRAR